MKIKKTANYYILFTAAVILAAAVVFLFFFISVENFVAVIRYSKPKIVYAQVLFAGDLMFDRGIKYYAKKNGSNEFIFKKISSFLKTNDLVVVNLEGPITDEKSVSYSTAPGSANNYFFTFDPSVAKTLFNENIKLVNLGNNHILNFFSKGLESTEKYLTKAHVDYFGAPEGKRSIIKEISGVKMGLISYNEFYGEKSQQESAVVAEIKKVKAEADVVFVFSHWGVEYQKEPSSSIKELAHKFIDAGADLVIGSHPHVIQQMEVYKERRIYYSLGNFIFDQYFNEDVRKGLGVQVKINQKTKEISFKEINFYLQSGGQTILTD